MANFMEKAEINPRRFVPFTSRYLESQIIYYTERRLLTFTIYRKHKFDTNRKDKFMVVSKGYEFRPDLVSQDAYGTPDFWWKIMESNNVKDVFDFKAGLNIRIPQSIF